MNSWRDLDPKKIGDRQSIPCDELLAEVREEKKGRFKSGYRTDVESTKLRLISDLGIDQNSDEYKNWVRGWAFASGWEANIARYLLWQRGQGLIIELQYEGMKWDFTDFPVWKEMKQKRASFYMDDFLILYPRNKFPKHWKDDPPYQYCGYQDIEVKGYFRKNEPYLKKIKNFYKFYPELATKMKFIVAENQEAHKKLRRLTWVDRDQFEFYGTIKKQMEGFITWE